MSEPQSRPKSSTAIPAPTDAGGAEAAKASGGYEQTLADLYRSEREARRAAEIGQQRFAFLAALSRQIAVSLDDRAVLQAAAGLIVPYLADRCYLYLRQDDGTLVPVASAAAIPSEEEPVRAIEAQFPIRTNPRHPISRAIASGESRLLRSVQLDDLAALAQNAAHLALLRSLDPHSMIAVPLIAHRQIVGGALLVTAGSGRHYGEADLAMAEEIGRRVALAVENAQLYQKARETIHLREEFLAIAAHELRTPVTSLRGFAQLILHQYARDRPPDPQQLQRSLAMIDRQAKRLSILVNQLLDISLSDAGQLVLSPEPTEVVALVNGVAETIRVGLVRHALNIRAAGPLTATVDPLRFELVIANLIENAIKYSPEGGPIDIEITQPSPEAICLVVRDHGIGIPAQHLPLIFDRFYRAHADSNYSGLGLGLYITQQIVRLHGGTLKAETPKDGGTRFTVTVPIRPPQKPPEN